MTNYPNLDDKIRINFFSSPKKRNSKLNSQIMCAIIGSFVYGGFNDLNHKNRHRIKAQNVGNGLETMWKCGIYYYTNKNYGLRKLRNAFSCGF